MSNGGKEEEKKNEIYSQKKYFALALDPVHIGTGGYRIGRVDNTIVREPATELPKIPGTTIEGVCRNYAYLKAKEKKIEGVTPGCAKGKVKDDKEPCGRCAICITFGYAGKDSALQAMALFSDARILLFPVATMIGPVWVTSPMVLKEAGIEEKEIPEPQDDGFILPEGSNLKPPEEKLNFGWLLLKQDNNKKTNTSSWKYVDDPNEEPKLLENVIPDNIFKRIFKRIVIVPDHLFPQIVNSNLEVRTSVAIDPERGAAEEGALFTYEAIPRGTVLWFDVVYQNPRYFPALKDKTLNKTLKWKDKNGKDIEVATNENTSDDDNGAFSLLKACVEDGLSLFQFLGVGGMSSRGFGRIKVLNLEGDKNDGKH
ncbi:MAG: type III-B CRISPR module RAMP protein Cmr4 [Pseudothermotoga sp.]|uniref:type III-B CRISPR module RAMP protein Cmr4 n=1 Tax=Pseudothermotoga sp. TaxID=2033661 RepID=UPI0007495C2A|nr:MAG: CRISPR-associated RAMP protein, Cmr4 family [Desulfonauticus sp. 38_4375]MBC7115936.1 type III-B CRISPR module RAMP protein Cmr4 [Pseudothermotoga sp.]HBT38892.1 type III-B CRISPR module RAMP protein Cmr4 [Pseudothermotoga sp.]HCO97859.1 type III-B CRISPR module RAMP protein Cmr4 [Pseudothermotoga sp.]